MLIKLLRRTTGHWTLERKSILFFGTTLLVSICASFWIVHRVSKGLVMQATRQTARDYAQNVVYNKHMIQWDPKTNTKGSTPLAGEGFNVAMRKSLYEHLIYNPRYQWRILTLDTISQHNLLADADPNPVTGEERELLTNLETQYRALAAKQSQAAVVGEATAATGETPAVDESLGKMGRAHPDANIVFRETGPVDGWYWYYHPLRFDGVCMECHYSKNRTSASTAASEPPPFRVVKVMMPYEETNVWSVWILSVMIAVAMVTLAVTLLILHLILRKLVIRPLRHLRDVSEEISRGKLDQRADIDTDDEFHELADAFNRMLRHLTETQEQLQGLNNALDDKVDQLAQANLHLYEANRLKSDFLANMSHELRTPLNSIIGFSDVLQDISSLTDKQKRYAANIQKSGRVLLEMINDILDLAKIEAGKLDVKPTLFDINQVLQAQCDMIRSLSEEKNIDVQIVTDPALAMVYQDANKIQQVVNNLLSNAVKFTPEGGLITITTGVVGQDFFQLTVADTGVGIPEADFEVIFEKFRQSNAILKGDNLTRQYSGTGLGLSIVKELCKLLGGEISLTSHVGKGSVFRVTLPRHFQNTMAVESLATDASGAAVALEGVGP
jgi:signal transduction histidine kinase